VSKLVLEVFPDYSTLLFCDSKKWYGNVVEMVARVINLTPNNCTSIMEHKKEEKFVLLSSLSSSGFVFPTLFLHPRADPQAPNHLPGVSASSWEWTDH
jgi:hypothetical protein